MDYILASWPHQPEVGSYGIFRPPLHSQKKSDAFGDSISFDSSFSQGFFPLVLTAALFFPLSLFVDQTDTVQPQNLLVVTFLLLFIARARGVQSYTVVWHHPQAKRLQPFQPPPPPLFFQRIWSLGQATRLESGRLRAVGDIHSVEPTFDAPSCRQVAMDDGRMQYDDGVTEHGSLVLALRSRCAAWRPLHTFFFLFFHSPPDFAHGGVVFGYNNSRSLGIEHHQASAGDGRQFFDFFFFLF